jgi:hypothetical protein
MIVSHQFGELRYATGERDVLHPTVQASNNGLEPSLMRVGLGCNIGYSYQVAKNRQQILVFDKKPASFFFCVFNTRRTGLAKLAFLQCHQEVL